MSYETLALCSGGGGYEAVPNPRASLDLPSLARRLESQGIAVLDARVMLIFRLAHEVTLGRDGRILIKSRDPAAADRLLREVCERLGLEGPTGAPLKD